jgi:hypothetical protein
MMIYFSNHRFHLSISSLKPEQVGSCNDHTINSFENMLLFQLLRFARSYLYSSQRWWTTFLHHLSRCLIPSSKWQCVDSYGSHLKNVASMSSSSISSFQVSCSPIFVSKIGDAQLFYIINLYIWSHYQNHIKLVHSTITQKRKVLKFHCNFVHWQQLFALVCAFRIVDA